MRLLIAAVGKLKQGPERELFAHYLGRAEAAGRKLHLSPLSVTEVAESRAATTSARVKAETETLLGKVPASYRLACLDPGGDLVSSEAFASLLAKIRDDGAEGLAFLIGGADGLGREAVARAAKVISFGPMTLPHGLARIVLAEQIYRAATILQGHPYHRG
jgi:23S rRNA (pseudouridine1915-N3)-methyltransferase